MIAAAISQALHLPSCPRLAGHSPVRASLLVVPRPTLVYARYCAQASIKHQGLQGQSSSQHDSAAAAPTASSSTSDIDMRAWLTRATQAASIAMMGDLTCQILTRSSAEQATHDGTEVMADLGSDKDSAISKDQLTTSLGGHHGIASFATQSQADIDAHEEGVVDKPLDILRTFSFGAFSFMYGGFIQRAVYRLFDAYVGMGGCPLLVAKKVALDTFVHAPIMYIPIFYMTTGLVQGKGTQGSFDFLCLKFHETMVAYFIIWPIPMAICFRFVPESFRVVSIAFCAYFEKVIFSYIGDRSSAGPSSDK